MVHAVTTAVEFGHKGYRIGARIDFDLCIDRGHNRKPTLGSTIRHWTRSGEVTLTPDSEHIPCYPSPSAEAMASPRHLTS